MIGFNEDGLMMDFCEGMARLFPDCLAAEEKQRRLDLLNAALKQMRATPPDPKIAEYTTAMAKAMGDSLDRAIAEVLL